MISTTPPAPSPTDRVPTESPFLPGDPTKLPNLAQIDLPTSALAEAQQQMKLETIEYPFPRQRHGKRDCARVPVTRHCVSPSFVMLWNGFCSARRTVFPRSMEEAEQMVVSETVELEAYAKETVAADGSLAPRGLCVSLVVPHYACGGDWATRLVDGMAAFSEMKDVDGSPIATKARFAVYGSLLSQPLEKVLRSSAFGDTTLEGVSIVLRWAELDSAGQPAVRTECELVRNSASSDPSQAARLIQETVVYMSTAYGVELPACMFAPAPLTVPRQFEYQFSQCSDEFHDLINHRDEFKHSQAMRDAGCTLLSVVPGVILRISPRAQGIAGVTSNGAMHALLLCADGQQDAARQYAMTNREGLPPLDEAQASKMLLHTAAVQVEPLKLGGMVSLFAQGGKPGEPIQPPGSWVWRYSEAIVPMQKVMADFFVMSCSLESAMPKRCTMHKFMQSHLQRSMDMFNSTFDQKDVGCMLRSYSAKRKVGEEVADDLSEEDKLAMVAMGININSKRMCLGQAISHLMTHGPSKSSLVDMLVKASTRVGLSASLSATFSSCVSSMEKEERGVEQHKVEVERLKRVADAALVMALSKNRQQPQAIDTHSDKVRALLKTFSLQPGRTSCSIKDVTEMDSSVGRSMCATIYEAYEARMCKSPGPHADQVESLFCVGADILVATCKALKVCMIPPGVEKDAFVILHGNGSSNVVRVFRVGKDGEPEACGIGPAFESELPVVVVLKLKPGNGCLATPIVKKPA